MEDWEDSIEQTDIADLTEESSSKKPKFSFHKIVSILLLSLIFLASLYGLCAMFGFNPITFVSDTISKLKPYSILDFEKLATPRPKGTIVPIECNEGKEFNPGIVYSDSQVDIYESYKFDKLIKTIKLPGKVDQVKCMYDNSVRDRLGSAKIGFITDETSTGLVIAIVYTKDGIQILHRMSIPDVRIIHWNYITGSKRDRPKESFWLLMAEYTENGIMEDKKLPGVELQIDEHPKNPFEYLKTDYWMELKGRNLLAVDTLFTYLASDDSKTLYRIDSDKIIEKYYTTDKPAVWSYCYKYEGRLDIIGFNGRFILKPTAYSEYPSKIDTKEDGDLEKSFICTNTRDKTMLGGVDLIWNGKSLIYYDENGKPPIYKIKDLKPDSSTSSFINSKGGVCTYVWQDDSEYKTASINFEAKMASSLPFPYGKQNEWSFLGSEIVFAIDQKKNPVFLVASDHRNETPVSMYSVKHIDEPVTDFYATVENGRPVFYLMNDKSIYRWENITDSMENLKPEILNSGETR